MRGSMKPIVVSVIGPTAVGKSKLGIEISKRFDGEVINGDSMQFYRGFNIGTAKVTKEEADGVAHHLIDFLPEDGQYSAAHFQSDLKSLVDEITARDRLPVVVGGTGFYIHSALYDFNFSEVDRNEGYVDSMMQGIEQNGIEPYFEKLKQVDPDQANRIHPHNIRRVVRALEVYERTGKTMSQLEQVQSNVSPYQPYIIGLDMPREQLYDRINRRVDDMIEEGLYDEVYALYQAYGSTIQAMQGIGYKEWLPYFRNEVMYDDVISQIKQNTRRFAKRQLTYYRNKLPDVHWYTIDPDRYEKTFETIFSDLAGFLKHKQNNNN